MRTFDDLNDTQKGAYMVRELIKNNCATLKYVKLLSERENGIRKIAVDKTLAQCIDICNECLDVPTLGDIE